jgi:hypothetical protein
MSEQPPFREIRETNRCTKPPGAMNRVRIALLLGHNLVREGVTISPWHALIWTLFLPLFSTPLIPRASGDQKRPTSTPSALAKVQVAETGADGLTTDNIKWRMLRADTPMYADEQAYQDAKRYEAEQRQAALLRMRWEARYWKSLTPAKVELLEEGGPHGMCKVRYMSKLSERVFDMWVAQSDVLPYDVDLEKKVLLDSEKKGRVHALIMLRDQLKPLKGKVVSIKENSLLFSQNTFWEFMTLVIQSQDTVATEKTIGWVQAYDGSAILAGRGSLGVVTSIDAPAYTYLKIDSNLNGQKTAFWVAATDVTRAPEAAPPGTLRPIAGLAPEAAAQRAKKGVQKAIATVDQVASILPSAITSARDGQNGYRNQNTDEKRAGGRYVHIDSQSADVVIEKNMSVTPEIINETNENEVTFEKSIIGESVEVTSKVRQPIVANPGRIIVRVPLNYDVDAKGMSAGFTVTSFEGDTLDVSSMSGNIKSSAVGGRRTKFTSMSGNIRVISPIISGTHEFEAISGDVVVMLGPGSSTKLFAQSDQLSASIDDKHAHVVPLEEIVGSGHASVRATTISGNVDCQSRPAATEPPEDESTTTFSGGKYDPEAIEKDRFANAPGRKEYDKAAKAIENFIGNISTSTTSTPTPTPTPKPEPTPRSRKHQAGPAGEPIYPSRPVSPGNSRKGGSSDWGTTWVLRNGRYEQVPVYHGVYRRKEQIGLEQERQGEDNITPEQRELWRRMDRPFGTPWRSFAAPDEHGYPNN